MSRKAEKKKVLPQGWSIKKLSQIGLFSKGRGITKSDLVNEGVPCIRYGEIYTVHHGSVKGFHSFITQDTASSSRKLMYNDLLFAGSGETTEEIGKSVAYRLKQEAYAGGDVVILRMPKNYRSDYIAYYLNTLGRSQLNKLGAGNSVVHIYADDLGKVKIILPPLPEQKAIASLLEKWDTAIEKTEALIEAKEKRFGWLRFRLIKKIQSAKILKFGDFLSESRIVDTSNDPKKRITVRLHLKGVGVRKYRGTETEGATQYFVRKSGQLIYGKQNIFRGSIGIVPNELDGYSSSQDIPAFDIADNIYSDWLLWYMSRPYFYERLEDFAAGSGSKRLHPKELFQMTILVPAFEEQHHIAETLNTAHREIDLLKKLAEQYRTQKRGLMRRLLTGEWRVDG